MKKLGQILYPSILFLLFGLIATNGCAPPNNPPVIDSLEATKYLITPSGSAEIRCTASDPDGDSLTYSWSANAGTISGQGATVTWIGPDKPGIYTILVDITDGKKGKTSGQIDIQVRLNNPPVIESLKATPPQVLQGTVSTIECIASDPDGDKLSYQWFANRGNISGQGSTVTWTAPLSCADYSVGVKVTDDMGGTTAKELTIKVVKPG